MALVPVATYDFAGTGALSGDWTQLNYTAGADLLRVSDMGENESAELLCFARWSGDTWADDQYSECEFYATSYDRYGQVGVRETGTTNNDGYEITLDGAADTPSHSVLSRYDDGTPTSLVDFDSGGFNSGDVVRIEMIGEDIDVYVEDSSIMTTEPDSTYDSGEPSVGVYNAVGTNGTVDNWVGGEIVNVFEIEAEPGSYAVTGSDVEFESGYQTNAAAGSYAVTGTAIALWPSAASLFFFNDFKEQLVVNSHNFNADAVMLYLSNATPDAENDEVKTDLAEISTGFGYTGPIDTQQTMARSTTTVTVTGTKITITAAAGDIATFRYLVLYNDDAGSDNLICWWDFGTTDLEDGDSLTILFNNSNPTGTIFTLV